MSRAPALPGAVWAVLGGVAWALCFGDQGLRLAPWLALAPLFLLLAGRRPAWWAFVHGMAFWLASLYWIAGTLVTFGRLPAGLAALGLLLLAAFLSLLFWLPLGLLGRRLWAAGGWRLVAGLPALWIALEWLREYLFSGFPWNLAAYAVIEVPGALPLASLVGSYGVSFLVVAVNAAAAAFLAGLRGGREGAWKPLAAAAGAAVVALVLGAAAAPPERSAAGQAVVVVQPNIPNLVAWDAALVERNYRQVLAMSEAACRPGALLILPESALWPRSYETDPRLVADLDRLARRGCRILFNSLSGRASPYRNSVLLVGPDGVEGRYDKRHLVPFGEYVPFAGVLPFVDKLARMAGDFAAGTDAGLIGLGEHELGAAICYEVVYPASVAAQVRDGATVLVTVVNDAWYGDTTAPWQHLRAARFRAAESDRVLLRAAITGVSAVIAPDGSVEQLLGVGRRGVLATRVEPGRRLTPYSRAPWLVPALGALLALAACARFPRR
ncbi:MAG: apolipoprotein N-acyltransferase [Acidobacteriota bacterium]|nr:apolipoprotein N-acyltransferase [Acidobacteriota bacterium]MDH3524355.1 apolipoprotein N-acyltransferase [Acidobacteriota bacterium]